MAHSIKQQLSEDLAAVKLQSRNRIKRIRTIAETAFSEAISEVKAGGQEVKATSQQSFKKVVQTVAPSDPAEAVITVTASEDKPISEAVADKMAEPMADSTAAAATQPTVTESFESNATDTTATDSDPQANDVPDATLETSKREILQALLKVAGLKAKSLGQEQYSQFKAQWPERSAQIHSKTDRWDEQLTQRYGDGYTELKTGLKQGYVKAVDWYQDKLDQGKAMNAYPLEQKQAQKAEDLGELGVKVAQKEAEVKQKMGQVLRTITVSSQP